MKATCTARSALDDVPGRRTREALASELPVGFGYPGEVAAERYLFFVQWREAAFTLFAGTDARRIGVFASWAGVIEEAAHLSAASLRSLLTTLP